MTPIQRLMEIAQWRHLTGREEQLLSQLLVEDNDALDEYVARCQLEADLRFLMRPERNADEDAVSELTSS